MPTTTSTATDTASTDVQFKTSDGRIVHGQFDSQDLQGMSVGDSLQITNLGTGNASGTNSSGSSTPNGSSTNMNNSTGTSNSTDSTNGTSSGASNNPNNMNTDSTQ